MKNIYIYCGLNVCDLKFQQACGKAVVQGFNKGVVTYSVDATHRHLPENSKHPRKYAEFLKKEVVRYKDYCELHISTNSKVTINLLGQMVEDGILSKENIKIYVLSEDNLNVEVESEFDDEGYLVNWPSGFLVGY